MTPQEFKEEMKKGNRVMSMDAFLKRNNLKRFPDTGSPNKTP